MVSFTVRDLQTQCSAVDSQSLKIFSSGCRFDEILHAFKPHRNWAQFRGTQTNPFHNMKGQSEKQQKQCSWSDNQPDSLAGEDKTVDQTIVSLQLMFAGVNTHA